MSIYGWLQQAGYFSGKDDAKGKTGNYFAILITKSRDLPPEHASGDIIKFLSPENKSINQSIDQSNFSLSLSLYLNQGQKQVFETLNHFEHCWISLVWLHLPRTPGVVMTTSVLLGWWMLGCSMEWVGELIIYIWSDWHEHARPHLSSHSQHHIPNISWLPTSRQLAINIKTYHLLRVYQL